MNIEELKKEMEIFGKGIERLEQLKAEFEKISTIGYEKEAQEIRSMLKDVSAIPELEVKIKNLKDSIKKDGLKQEYKLALKKDALPADITRKDLEELKRRIEKIFEEFAGRVKEKEGLLKKKEEAGKKRKIEIYDAISIENIYKIYNKSCKALKKGRIRKAKKLYKKLMRLYLNLSDIDKRKVYREINSLYEEIKNEEMAYTFTK